MRSNRPPLMQSEISANPEMAEPHNAMHALLAHDTGRSIVCFLSMRLLHRMWG
jgi:hypothetical protein